MEEYYLIKDACIKRWSLNQPDDKVKSFDGYFEKWIAGLNAEIIPTVLSMIEKFEYYSHEMVNKHLGDLHLRFLKTSCINAKYALYTYIKKKNGNINSSIDYWQEYRLFNNIPKEFCSDDVVAIDAEQWLLIKIIVIVDDCCGTGESLEKYLKSTELDFSGKTVYYIVIHALEKSSILIDKIMEEFHVKIILLTANYRGKVFCFEPPNGISPEKEQFISASIELGIPKEYCLGYKESEALMAFYNNTPNNTFGLFWHSNNNYSSIFPRDARKKPPWENELDQIKKAREARCAQKYYGKKKSIKHD